MSTIGYAVQDNCLLAVLFLLLRDNVFDIDVTYFTKGFGFGFHLTMLCA